MSDQHTTPEQPAADGTAAEAPQPKRDGNDIKWYDKRLLVSSTIVALLSFAMFYGLAMRHKPPLGHVFERAPVLSGIYKCCYAGGRYSASWVGNESVSCHDFDYFGFTGTNRNDCGFKEQLNGQPVEITRAYIPTTAGSYPIGVRITSNGHTYYDESDEHIRDRWIHASTTGAMVVAMFVTLIFNFIYFVYLTYFHKPNSDKGQK